MSIQVDTDAVRNTAIDMGYDNEAIRGAFFSMETTVLGVLHGWTAPSVEKMEKQFCKIKETYYESRTANMQEFILYLQQVVGEGYETAETAAISIADSFK